MSTKSKLLLLTQGKHMVIDPRANPEVVKKMRHIASG